MAYTNINSEDRLVQKTFADHLEKVLGWENVYAWNDETFGPTGTLGRESTRDVVLTRDLLASLVRLNPELPATAFDEAVGRLSRHDVTRSLLQHNQEFYRFIREGVPVSYRDAQGQLRHAQARVIDFQNGATNGQPNNRFVAVRELKLTGLKAPSYNRRADLVCFVNGLPLVFIELKAVYRNIRAGFDGNLRDYMDENVVAHAFHHNAFLIVSNGHRARYGSITSQWEHFAEWKRLDERDKGKLDAEMLLNGMLAHDRLLDIVENFILFDGSKPGATRKVIARNHQVLGVNNAVRAVERQEELKRAFPPEKRLAYRVVELPPEEAVDSDMPPAVQADGDRKEKRVVELIESAHPELGKLGVFWHTQGSGKSYSMAFFAEKVRRRISAAFTFLLMTDRNDLDSQIYRTFIGCGVADEGTPRASSGEALEALLKEIWVNSLTAEARLIHDVLLTRNSLEYDEIIHLLRREKLAVHRCDRVIDELQYVGIARRERQTLISCNVVYSEVARHFADRYQGTESERAVWPLIEQAEKGLRKLVRRQFESRWAHNADEKIRVVIGEDAWTKVIDNQSKHAASYPRAVRSPEKTDVLEFTYLGQLGQMMMCNRSWDLFRHLFRDKRELEDILRDITPVRNTGRSMSLTWIRAACSRKRSSQSSGQ
jgi:hypothetical protein